MPEQMPTTLQIEIMSILCLVWLCCFSGSYPDLDGVTDISQYYPWQDYWTHGCLFLPTVADGLTLLRQMLIASPNLLPLNGPIFGFIRQ